MSLSKYYSNSDMFQPEELVKRDDTSPSGWSSSYQMDRLSFESQQPLERLEADHGRRKPPAQTKAAPSSPPSGEEDRPSRNGDQTEPAVPVAQPPIDLANYLELAEAEARIEAAYQKGLAAGSDKCEQDYGAATRALLNTCQQLDTIRETIIGNSRLELLELVLAISQRIIRLSVREQDSTIVATIEEALHRAVKSDEFVIYLHPKDHDIVMTKSDSIVAGLSGLNKIVIKKDSSISRGGAKIESDNCTVDATIESQFEAIREALREGL